MAAMNNMTSIKTASNGAWQGDNPLDFAFPLLSIQTILVLLLFPTLSFLLKPLHQPKVVAEIITGILLGPSALSRSATFSDNLFPTWSLPVLDSVASLGLLFFLFLVGLELDLASIRRTGLKATAIGAAGIFLPFFSGAGVAVVLRRTVSGADQVAYAPFLVFMGVSISITAFPVLARILIELKLLTTPIGETAMAAAAINDVAAWVLLVLAIALSGDQKSPLVSVYVFLSGVAFVVLMVVIVRPTMAWTVRRWGRSADGEAYIGITLTSVLAAGFATDLIGVHAISAPSSSASPYPSTATSPEN